MAGIPARGRVKMEVEKFLFKRAEAAFSIGVSVRSVDYLIAKGELATRRVGSKVLVTRESLRLFARGHHPEAMKDKKEPPETIQ